ncbi:carbohydrate kinase family protein [Gracilibacillus timonensis]|uniref:carbohydrate kinase family protein n=1 Tax=Gracilibacillus timonensis TaxID=1816696 RepID=UPI000825B043|nr:carbohydrate kinase family protein [Gracilibacillus timonensis]
MDHYDVLVVGPFSVDVIFSSIPRLPNLGEEVYCGDFEFTCGASYNVAVALARLGLKVTVAAPLGNDFLSSFILENLKKEGVNTEHIVHLDKPLRTLSVALNYDGDRSFISYEDKINDFDYQGYINSVVNKVSARALYISLNENAVSIVESAKNKNWLIFQDVGWDEEWLQEVKLQQLVSAGDYFLPNLKEALIMTNEHTIESALDQLNTFNTKGVTIIKLGEDGAIFKSGNTKQMVPTTKKQVMDTTGAGDVFVAGVMTGILKGYCLSESIQLGNFCGGCSVQGLGGTKCSPTWDQVIEELRLQ